MQGRGVDRPVVAVPRQPLGELGKGQELFSADVDDAADRDQREQAEEATQHREHPSFAALIARREGVFASAGDVVKDLGVTWLKSPLGSDAEGLLRTERNAARETVGVPA
jgi:DNA-binding PucR family transcriptional regulator